MAVVTDFRLMSGDGWIRCCICGELHFRPYPNLFLDEEGDLHDVCRVECAEDAGLAVPE